jgi:hypothetical protein
MPRRTVTVTRLWGTTRRRMGETQDLSRLGGTHDVLHLAGAFFVGIPPQDLIDHSQERYVAIEKMVPAGRTLLLELAVGTFEDSGPTRDVITGKTEHTRGRHHSAATTVRALVAMPQRATSALIFLEHSSLRVRERCPGGRVRHRARGRAGRAARRAGPTRRIAE